jgi:hypothetical protein
MRTVVGGVVVACCGRFVEMTFSASHRSVSFFLVVSKEETPSLPSGLGIFTLYYYVQNIGILLIAESGSNFCVFAEYGQDLGTDG